MIVLFENTCCFIGHRKINVTNELKLHLKTEIENLIENHGVDTFLFGSKSKFNDLCLECVTEIKEKRPNIKRIYVRAEYFYINEEYKNYLAEYYDDTYYPEKIRDAGRTVYVQRNYEMIEKSRFCVFYYDEGNLPTARKSGTKIALNYAVRRKREIIVLGD